MLFHDFQFKGKLASEMGVIVQTQAEYIRPAKRVITYTVPGRAGMLTQDEGEEAYDPVQMSPVCYLSPGADCDVVGDWLDGSGELVLGSMPDYAYEAQVINQIPFSRIFQGRGGYMTFTPIFQCQPFRRLAQEPADLVFTTAGTLTNPGNVSARPLIRVEASGDVVLQVGMEVVLTNLDGGILIDAQMEDCLNLEGSLLMNDRLIGDFPLIPPGTWPVKWTGNVSRVTITPRWRYR